MAIEGTCDTEIPPIREPVKNHLIACHLTIDEMVEADKQTQQILHGFEKLGDDEVAGAAAH